jgi:hypothetical protein
MRNQKLDIALTLDYEVYGDGGGDIFETMVHPTDELLRICKKYGAKVTIFFEVLEFIRFREEWQKGNKMGYESDPILAISNQLKEAYLAGHDVQLHIHPHWLTGKYKDGTWHLDPYYWKLTNVPLEPTEKYPLGLEALIKLCKEEVEKIIQEVSPSYSCNIFRAGGFSVTPSIEITKVLKKLGFIADSSVIPGGYLDNEYFYYDFRNCSIDKPFWFTGQELHIQDPGQNGLIEFPVFALNKRRISKYDLQRIKVASNNKSTNLNKIKGKVGKESTFLGKIKYFFEKEMLCWDFCLFSSHKMNAYFTEAFRRRKNSKDSLYPIILLGHSKEFLHPKGFEAFIKYHLKNINFYTLSGMVRCIKDPIEA